MKIKRGVGEVSRIRSKNSRRDEIPWTPFMNIRSKSDARRKAKKTTKRHVRVKRRSFFQDTKKRNHKMLSLGIYRIPMSNIVLCLS